MLSDIKQAFEPHGYILTVAVAAIPTDAAYDVPAMSKYVIQSKMLGHSLKPYTVS